MKFAEPKQLLDRRIDETLVIDRNHYQVLTDAKMLLRDLTAPEAIGEWSDRRKSMTCPMNG